MICFLINVYDESLSEVQKVIHDIERTYPNPEIHICYDGSEGAMVRHPNAFRYQQRLKTKEHGGAWTHRYLNHFLRCSDATYLIKLDPDSDVIRPIKDLPGYDCIFARYQFSNQPNRLRYAIHGGVLGFTRSTARMIVDNRWMEDVRYKNRIAYMDSNDVMLNDIVFRHELILQQRNDFACGTSPESHSTFSHP